MSRSGYGDVEDNWSLIKWRGQVASAIRGKRGQVLLKDLLAALDAMPEKRLVVEALEADGEVCALGALGRVRGLDMAELNPEDYDAVANSFGVAAPLVQEIVYMNDEQFSREWSDDLNNWIALTPDDRWSRMRAWVAKHIKVPE